MNTAPGARLVAISVRPAAGAACERRETATISAAMGLSGDYHVAANGKPQHLITLIESEALESALSRHGIELSHLDSRRNLLTHGVDLNSLVGREFRVGEATLRGTELCPPCSSLEKCTKPGVMEALRGRGGLYAVVLKSGTIRNGDPIVV